MSNQSPKSPDTIQARVEQLTDEAKKLSSQGKETAALETYRKASELMPGAPWLQHRTAELARKLKQSDVAAQHYRRAGAAFIGAGFPKRALAPLRTAWALHLEALPKNPAALVSLTLDLAELQRELGFPADGTLSITNANEALQAAGCLESVPAMSELAHHPSDKALRASDPGIPESGVTASPHASAPGILARVRSALRS